MYCRNLGYIVNPDGGTYTPKLIETLIGFGQKMQQQKRDVYADSDVSTILCHFLSLFLSQIHLHLRTSISYTNFPSAYLSDVPSQIYVSSREVFEFQIMLSESVITNKITDTKCQGGFCAIPFQAVVRQSFRHSISVISQGIETQLVLNESLGKYRQILVKSLCVKFLLH